MRRKLSIIWDGNNTKEVVEFCSNIDGDLCRIYHIYTNLVTGILTLAIEPSDTMRGACLDIPIGHKATWMRRYFKIS